MKIKIFIKIFFLYIFIALLNAEPDPNLNKPEVSFHLSHLDSILNDILWCGGGKEIVLILSEIGSIYRSTDKGFKWNKLTDVFQRSGYGTVENDEKVGVVKKLIKSHADDNLVIFQGSEGINWISEDCGSTIKAMNQGRNVHEFQFHPTEKNWLLAAAWNLCSDFADEPCQIYKELFVSFDLGENWKLIEDYVVQFAWGVVDEKAFYTPNAGNLTDSSKVPKERILLAHEPAGKGHQNILGWSEKVHLSYSDDFFKTFKTIVNQGNKFLLSRKYLFVVHAVDEQSQEVGLVVADPNVEKYDFKDVELPMRHFKEHSYTILDTTEGQVFLHVNHFGETSKHGNIYISDSTGHRFSTSLMHNVRSLEGECDFTKVKGLQGIYIANVYDEKKLKTAVYALESEKEGGVVASKKKGSGASLYEKLRNFKKTLISFDKGGMWKPIQAPIKDSKGKKIYCPNDECTLHLHSASDMTYGPVYSTEASIGMLLSTGNVGYYLADRADEINTYFSRDGGLTWFEVAKGSHIYEISDHGGIVVLANDQEATDKILYSWNEGLTFEELKFTDTPLEIHNIITEPTFTGTSFIVYGESDLGNGVVIGLDFSSLHQRVCKGVDSPNTEESDFEYWTPNGLVSSTCLLGSKITYVRKKRESKCFNGEEFERINLIEKCECTEEDWECDLGYVREKSGPCKSLNRQEIDYSAPANCSSYYFVSQGYRKVAGDNCVGGVNHEPLKIACPGYLADNKSSGYIKIIFLFVLIAAAVFIATNQNFMDLLKEKYNYIVALVREKLQKKKDTGYGELHHIIDTHEHDFNKMIFEENEDKSESIEDNVIDDEKDEKKIAERGGVQTASKHISILRKPAQQNEPKKSQNADLLLDHEDEETSGFH